MNRNFFDENPYCSEATAEGTCSFDPTIISLREVITNHSKQLAYYILKLEELGYFDEETVKMVMQILASAIINADMNNKDFQMAVAAMKNKIAEYEELYKNMSIEKELDYQLLKSYYESGDEKMSDIISRGEKQLIKKNLDLSKEKRSLQDIILQLVRSASVATCDLSVYENNTKEFEMAILKLLNVLNFTNSTPEQLKKRIEKFTEHNYRLIMKRNEVVEKAYGPVHKVKVSKDEIPGKAILVSGHNLQDLENLLNSLGEEDIKVYTHDGLLMAHAYEKFRAFPQLVGHYQVYSHSTSSDFGKFPGAILITRSPMDELDSFIRGRVFTTALFAGLGIVKIRDNDFSSLIESAKNAEGFTEEVKHDTVTVGYISENKARIISELKQKIESGEVKSIVVIKINDVSGDSKKYFTEFIDRLPEDVFVFASFQVERKNYVFIDALHDFPIFYEFINEVKDSFDEKPLPVSMFLSHCNVHTISHMLTLRYLGIEHIYLDNCSYFMINPTTVHTLEEFFGIKNLSETIKKDLFEMPEYFSE